MNDVLQQLIGMGPGIGAAVSGDGNAFASFMEGWQRAQREDEQRKRLQQQDTLAMEDRDLRLQDRQRGIERQTAADQVATQQRGQQQALQSLQIPGQLAELGGAADSPEGAQAMIEAAMPNLMKAFGQESMAFGQPAVEMAQRTITGRQKKQVESFVEAALKTSFVADNPESDPELVNLPEHIAKIVGKPQARLSELQQFAQLPVGKPAGKTRVPPAAGSMEEFSDPNITPERKAAILADRKAYMQSDDRPRVDVRVDGGLNANQQALMTERLAKGWNDANTSGREMRRALGLMETGLKRFREGDKNGGSQAVLVTFQKILDPTSVVRESEYARSAAGISMLGRMEGFVDRLRAGGAGVPDAELAAMVETARQMLAGMQGYSDTQRSRIEAMAKKYEIDPVLVFGMEAPETGAAPAPGGGPKLKERRKFGDVLGEWNGKEWVEVKPQ